MTEPLRILFVCTANICRSPFMELLTQHLAADALLVSSAGTHGFEEHVMDATMAVGLTERGVEFDAFRSRRLTVELVDEADLVLTAEASHRQFVLDEHPAAFRKVFTLGQFAEAVRRSPELSGRELVAETGAHRPPTNPSQDVPDPYRRGAEAAASSAIRIEELLSVIVPALAAGVRRDPDHSA